VFDSRLVQDIYIRHFIQASFFFLAHPICIQWVLEISGRSLKLTTQHQFALSSVCLIKYSGNFAFVVQF
jgi:hypothetical protein